MAKITGPLMSVSARGRIGGSLVFRETKGIPVAQKFTKVHDRKSPAQLEHRNRFRGVVAAWKTHTPEEKATLEPKVRGLPLTTYDYYVKRFFETGEDPLGPPPVPEFFPLSDITNAHLPITISTEPLGFIFFSHLTSKMYGNIADPENIYYDGVSTPEPEFLLIIAIGVPDGLIIPAGYEIIIDTDVATNFHIRLTEVQGPGNYYWIVLEDGSVMPVYP